jgi:hypothetical protein
VNLLKWNGRTLGLGTASKSFQSTRFDILLGFGPNVVLHELENDCLVKLHL